MEAGHWVKETKRISPYYLYKVHELSFFFLEAQNGLLKWKYTLKVGEWAGPEVATAELSFLTHDNFSWVCVTCTLKSPNK